MDPIVFMSIIQIATGAVWAGVLWRYADNARAAIGGGGVPSDAYAVPRCMVAVAQILFVIRWHVFPKRSWEAMAPGEFAWWTGVWALMLLAGVVELSVWRAGKGGR